MTEPAPNGTPTSTEDVAAAPGWVEPELDRILEQGLGPVAGRPAVRGLRNNYLDCLAGLGRGADPDAVHDRCRRRFLQALAHEGVDDEQAGRLEQKLEALEADITARI